MSLAVNILQFGRMLRAAGLDIHHGRLLDAVRALEWVDVGSRADVAATLPFLNRQHRTMVRLQWLTGMRPGEVCRLRLAEVDRSGGVWAWDLGGDHKTAHRGKRRVVLFGPLARAAVAEFAAGGEAVPDHEPLFSPRRARAERFAGMRARRRSFELTRRAVFSISSTLASKATRPRRTASSIMPPSAAKPRMSPTVRMFTPCNPRRIGR